ncbi:MAG: hypothetical protein HRT73_14990 [Flavobacteriales bacterium]|nr:hypothetical protein [Flavobacteriales bacterium]
MLKEDEELNLYRCDSIISAYESYRKDQHNIGVVIGAGIAIGAIKKFYDWASTPTYSSSSSYVSSSTDRSIDLCVPIIPRESSESNECRAKTASSSYENATVRVTSGFISGCYDLNISASKGNGGGNTCSGTSGTWSVRANGVTGNAEGLSSAISWILMKL